MSEYKEAFLAFDVAKAKNAVALAEGDRNGEVRYLGEIANTPEATLKLVKKLEEKYHKLHFCYEAGPTGYGLHRQITDLGHACIVVAPSLIPWRPGDRVKTNRRDAVTLAKLLRAGELTAVWVPDAIHEAVRDLSRARETALEELRRKRQQVTSFLLRHGRVYPGKKTWSTRHARWLADQRFAHPAQQIVLQEAIDAVHEAEARLGRLEQALAEVMPTWSMAPVVRAYQAMRGIAFLTAVTFVAEVGDLRRFDSPRQLMGYLGLVPSERSTGDSVRRGGITKTGNRRARRILVEGAWTYRHGARVGRGMLDRLTGVPKAVKDMAWKAQIRLCGRYRRLMANGKRPPSTPRRDHGHRPGNGGVPLGHRPARGAHRRFAVRGWPWQLARAPLIQALLARQWLKPTLEATADAVGSLERHPGLVALAVIEHRTR